MFAERYRTPGCMVCACFQGNGRCFAVQAKGDSNGILRVEKAAGRAVKRLY